MSTLAEQVVEQLKTDMDNVYDAGYQRGLKEVGGVDVSKFGIQNEVKGTNIVTLDYVNENEHNVEVQLSSDTVTDFSGVEVKCTGSQLFDLESCVGFESLYVNFDNEIDVENRTITITNKSNNTGFLKLGHLLAGTYYLSCLAEPSADTITSFLISKGSMGIVNRIISLSLKGGIFTVDEESDIYMVMNIGNEKPTVVKNISLNYGSKELPYEPYVEKTYFANVDGTVDGVTSISPLMNIICEDVDISAKYYQSPSVEYNKFWDVFQDNGNRTDYAYSFGGKGWTSETFKPKYDIKPTVASSIFQKSNINCDLVALLNELGIVLDFANCSAGIGNAFQESTFTRVGVIDARQCPNINYLFTGCTKLEVVDKIILSDTVAQGVSVAFSSCSKLREIRIEGKIRANLGMLQSSLLSAESIQSIIDALADLTGQTAQTITFHADVKAKLTDTQIATITGKNWTLA